MATPLAGHPPTVGSRCHAPPPPPPTPPPLPRPSHADASAAKSAAMDCAIRTRRAWHAALSVRPPLRPAAAARPAPGGGRPTAVVGVGYVPSGVAAAGTAGGAGRPLCARRGVVVAAAGPPDLAAPLLHRSGVGPVTPLRDAGTPPLVDHPVGERIQARAAGCRCRRLHGRAACTGPYCLRGGGSRPPARRGEGDRGGLLATAPPAGLSWTTAGGGWGGGDVSSSFAALGARRRGRRSSLPRAPPDAESLGRLRVTAANGSVADPPVVETNPAGKRGARTWLRCWRACSNSRWSWSPFRPAFGMVLEEPALNGRTCGHLPLRACTWWAAAPWAPSSTSS